MADIKAAARVSVLIPAYNVAEFIGEAIDSILSQTWTDFDLLVVDDGSTDATLEILERYAKRDARVRYIRTEQNQGRPSARNTGLALLRGEYVALMDADDRCHPERLTRQVRYLDAHSEVDVLGTLWWVTERNGDIHDTDGHNLQSYSADQIAVRMLFTCPIHQPTMMIRAAAIARYKYDTSFPVAEDHELWVRMIKRHRFEILPVPLLYYRQHSAQATAQDEAICEGRQRVVAQQLEMLNLSFDQQDLFRLEHLYHFKKRKMFERDSGMSLDLDFVVWARGWIERLIEANRTCGNYPDPAFSQFLAARWYLVCRKAAHGRSERTAIWRQFFGSRLLPHIFRAACARQLKPF